MGYEQRENSGSLFVNEKREKDSHPNARGSALIDGVEYWVDAWTKPGRNGKPKWQSLAFKRKDTQSQKPAAKPTAAAPSGGGGARGSFEDDDIPFVQHERRTAV